jgi:hypothetical protein
VLELRCEITKEPRSRLSKDRFIADIRYFVNDFVQFEQTGIIALIKLSKASGFFGKQSGVTETLKEIIENDFLQFAF